MIPYGVLGRRLKVNLDNVRSCLAAVLNGYICLERISILLNVYGCHLDIRIGQTKAEGIKDVVLGVIVVAIGAVAHEVIGEFGQLIDILIEGNRQLAGRRNLSEQDICDRLAALRAGVERLQKCIFAVGVDVERRAGGDNDNGGLADI